MYYICAVLNHKYQFKYKLTMIKSKMIVNNNFRIQFKANFNNLYNYEEMFITINRFIDIIILAIHDK